MKTCLVSMISEQTIPNILVISAIKPDHLLFISTESMENKNKSGAILESLFVIGMDYRDKTEKLIVPENSIPDFHEKVMEWMKNNRKEYEFIINLTGGTKLMSLAAYELFKSYGAEMLYMPIPRNEYFPLHHPEQSTQILTRLSVEAYLAAYGAKVNNLCRVTATKAETRARRNITCFIFKNYKELEPLLKRIGIILRGQKEDHVKKKGCEFTITATVESSSEKTFLKMMGLNDNSIPNKVDYSTWNYLRGGWLEERLFLALEAVLPSSADICLNIICEVNNNKNEYDVLAVHENVLYVVECKSLQAKEGDENNVRSGEINEFLYKLGALRQVFGLTPKTLLATTSEDILMKGEVKTNLIERGRLFNSQIIPLWQVKDLEGWLKDNVFRI